MLRVAATLAAVLAAGCSAGTGSPSRAATAGKTVCEVMQGPRNAGLNRAVQSAVSAARATLGIKGVVEPTNGLGVGPFPNAHCALILASGYEQAPPVFTTANRYPQQRYLIADDWFDFNSAPDLTRPNVSVAAFEANQASFLAGYVAAAVSPDHVVGVFGSVSSPTVELAMNGFLAGALAYGEDFRTHVRVLGWNGVKGQFVGNDVDSKTAYSISTRLIKSGAHVIFGVAGQAILGSAQAVERHPSTYAIGMYVDGHSEAPHYATKWLTSVVLDLRAPVIAAIKAAVSGASPTLYVGTIANGGVGLAPFRRLRSVVPNAVLAKLPSLRTGLIHDWISTNPADYVPAEKERGGGNG